jgi:hypothetical protein
VRARLAAVVAVAGLAGGCTEFAFVLRPPPQFVGVATWATVPEGQQAVQAKVGDVLHLPLGPSWGGPPTLYAVTVNGEAPKHPAYCSSLARTSFVFDAREAGEYEVECRDWLGDHPPRLWHITVAE